MSIGCKEIQRGINDILADKGFRVVANEAVEGSKKPCCTVDAVLSSAERLNDFIEEDTFNAEIIYYPAVETREELIKAAEKLRLLLLYTPIEVDGRVIDTYRIDFEFDDPVLISNVSYTLTQNTPYEEEDFEEMTELVLDM